MVWNHEWTRLQVARAFQPEICPLRPDCLEIAAAGRGGLTAGVTRRRERIRKRVRGGLTAREGQKGERGHKRSGCGWNSSKIRALGCVFLQKQVDNAEELVRDGAWENLYKSMACFLRAELGLESPSYGESQKHTGIFGQVQSGEAGVRKSQGVGPPHPRPLSPTGGEGRISVFSWVLYAKGCGMSGLGLESPSYEGVQ